MFWMRKKADIPVKTKFPLNQAKLEIIDFAFTTYDLHSFADLGGIWGVDGGYTFYALDNHKVDKAILVDTHFTKVFEDKKQKYPNLQSIQGNFGDEKIIYQVGQVDAIFLFDVLLHQVAPNWDQVLEKYATQAKCLVIYNQQWLGSKNTVRLLELGEAAYFQNVPHTPLEPPYNDLFQKLHQKHPDHDRVWKDVHNIWQWGITDIDLKNRVESIGFRMQFFKNCGRFGNLLNFENHAFVFTK